MFIWCYIFRVARSQTCQKEKENTTRQLDTSLKKVLFLPEKKEEIFLDYIFI